MKHAISCLVAKPEDCFFYTSPTKIVSKQDTVLFQYGEPTFNILVNAKLIMTTIDKDCVWASTFPLEKNGAHHPWKGKRDNDIMITLINYII